MIDYARLEQIRRVLQPNGVPRPASVVGMADELLVMVDTLLAPPKADPEEYRRLEGIAWKASSENNSCYPKDDVRYLLDLIDQRDLIIHDQTLDAQWATAAELGRIVRWLRERADRMREGDPPYSWRGAPYLDSSADELESQGIGEPLQADYLRRRVEVLEAGLRELNEELKIAATVKAENIMKRLLESKTE